MAEASRPAGPGANEEAVRRASAGAAAASRQIFAAWASGVEASLRATFEAENAALQAGLSVLEATAAADRDALQQWTAVARQAQDAALEAFRSQLRATQQLLDAGPRG
jgi:hypothetical protein